MAGTKIRVLYPVAFANLPHPPEAGDTISVDAGQAEQYIAAGYAEAVGRSASTVEQATAAPGEKRNTPRKRTNKKAAG